MAYRRVVYKITCKREQRKRYTRDLDKIIKIILHDANTAYVQFRDKKGDYRLSKKIKICQRKDNTYFLSFEKKRFDVDLDSDELEQLIGDDGRNEVLRVKGYYNKHVKPIKPTCPKCNQSLGLGVNTVGYWEKKIKVDGTLSVYTSRSYGKPNRESEFLYCPKCDYIYHFGGSEKSERNEAFDNWHDVIMQDNYW